MAKKKTGKKLFTGAMATMLTVTMISGCAVDKSGTGIENDSTQISVDKDSLQEDAYTYELLEDGTVKLIAYSGQEEVLMIPEYMDDKPVTVIGESCFAGNIHLKKVVVPEGVTELEKFSFECCGALEKIYLPESLISIGDGAFSGCGSLYFVDLQEQVEQIGKGAFMECHSLLSFRGPSNLKEIGAYAFAFCTEMVAVDLRNTKVTEIPNRCFLKNSSITKFNLPMVIERLGIRSLDSCESMTYLNCPESLKEICAGALTNTLIPREKEYFSDSIKVDPQAYDIVVEQQDEEENVATENTDGDSAESVEKKTESDVALVKVSDLEKEAADEGYLIVHNDEFDDWADSYLAFNEGNVLTSSDKNVYISKYKGEIDGYFQAMTAVASQDPEAIKEAKLIFGDDFQEMYEMVNHGLTTEMSNFKMEKDMLLYTGVYDHQLKAAAGTDHVPSMEELKACIGNTFTDSSLTSTTTDAGVSFGFGDTIFVIYAPADALNRLGSVSMDAYMRTYEKEILLDSGATYKIMDVGIMEMEVEDDEGKKVMETRNFIKLLLQ